MSLHATTVLTRQLLRPHANLHKRTLTTSLRAFSSDAKGSGLRRIRNTRVNTSSSTTSIPPPAEAAAASTDNPLKVDPHAIAAEMIRGSNTAIRPSGSEAVASLTPQQKTSNYAMAGGLLVFVSYVFYYSLASVGGVDNARAVMTGSVGRQIEESGDDDATNSSAGFAEFMKEAKEGLAEEEVRLAKVKKDKREADKLIDLDKTGGVGGEEEREMSRVAGFEEGEGGSAVKRPLWRRVVFFWRRD